MNKVIDKNVVIMTVKNFLENHGILENMWMK